ncbi:MAG: L-threonine 3-dehydrogenase [Candidatus Dormibacteraeota bacterium]|nr:L-threonine 3-dehydrogenase [Candidatus Dormibacteraeota bacterium]MBV9524630.1 L-threonine 3-dehydrogenase [Candidatus Dormibacteraeota bacterium]
MQAVLKARPAAGFDLGDVAQPRPGAGEVLLRVAAASVCGTDVHLYDWNPWAQLRVHPPRVVGHEMCGEVVAWGDGVRSPAVGTRVAVESHIVCGHCEECRRGDYHVCENTRILGVDVDGAFASHVALPAANVWPVGGNVSPQVAAAMEPFGNAVHACSYGDLAGRRVVVFGCGPIGCAAIAVARVQGASRVIAVDRNDYRLHLAERMGAHSVVRASETPVDDDVRRAAGGDIDCALEMSGSSVAVASATRLVRPGGWISLLGIGDGPDVIDLSNDVVMKGLALYGVVGRKLPSTWERTTAYVRDGVIDVAALITHSFPMSDVDSAIALIKSGQCGKVTLTPPD